MVSKFFLKKISLLLTMLLVTSGCATRKISIRSTPPGATVEVGDQISTTPCTLEIPKDAQVILLDLEGYKHHEIKLGEHAPAFNRLIHGTAKAHAKFAQIAGMTLAVVGGLGLLIWANEEDDNDFESDDEQDVGWTFFGISMSFLLGGSALIVAGRAAEESLEDQERPYSYYVELKPNTPQDKK